MNLVKFQPEHIKALRPDLDGTEIAQLGPAFTGLVDGHIVACGGFVNQWPGRAIGWIDIAPTAGRHFAAIHKACMRFFKSEACNYRRIETYVRENAIAIRWHWQMGFICEAWLPAFFPDGSAAFLFALLRDEVL
jgi:hypothetical protein